MAIQEDNSKQVKGLNAGIDLFLSLSSFTFSVGFGASLDQPDGILHKLPTWLHELHDLVHGACLD